MTLNQQLVWFLGMAGVLIAILTLGTLVAADLIHLSRRSREEERPPSVRREAAEFDPAAPLTALPVLVAPMGRLETAGVHAPAPVPAMAQRGAPAMVDAWGEDSFPASDPPQNW